MFIVASVRAQVIQSDASANSRPGQTLVDGQSDPKHFELLPGLISVPSAKTIGDRGCGRRFHLRLDRGIFGVQMHVAPYKSAHHGTFP
jgi:hypothetical protein